MKRLASALLALLAASALPAAEPAKRNPPPAITVDEIRSPAAAGSLGGSLSNAPDGTVWLTWIERGVDGTASLRFSRLDPAASAWAPAGTIATGRNWFLNWADFPALTIGRDGRATACWFVENPAPAAGAIANHDHDGPGYHALLSSTTDDGKTWSAPAPLTRASTRVEFVALATLADGRVLAAWLDGRAKTATPRAPQQLYARIVGAGGPDTLIDASVCDCCQTALTAFPDGSALLAYRGRGDGEVRDIRLARFDGRSWDEPRPLNNDDWRIAGCPVNGPQLASEGGRVAAAWFTAADNDPRVLASYSPDAGGRFLMPLRVDTAKPAGRVDTLLLRDGALLVTWAAVDGTWWLRRISPEFSLREAVVIAPAGTATVRGFARAALVRDYAGGKSAAQAIVAVPGEADGGRVRTLRVTIPEGELIEAERDCDCAPKPEELQGFALRGTIVALDAAAQVLRVRHGDVPGIFRGGTRDLKVPAGLLTAPGVAPGREFLGRIEQRDGAWWLLNLRLLAIK